MGCTAAGVGAVTVVVCGRFATVGWGSAGRAGGCWTETRAGVVCRRRSAARPKGTGSRVAVEVDAAGEFTTATRCES